MKILKKTFNTLHTPKSQRFIAFNLIISFLLIFIYLDTESASAELPHVNIDDQISIEYFIDPNCEVCIEKLEWFAELKELNPSLNYTEHDIKISGSDSNLSEYFEYTRSLGFGEKYPPLAVFRKGNCIMNLHGANFTYENVFNSYDILVNLAGECPDWDSALSGVSELTLSIAFISGIVTGLSPCVVLITSFISSTLIINKEKKKLLSLFLGFTIGVLLMYILLTIALITAFESFAASFFNATIRYIFAGLMTLLGVWYILDAYNENSKLFKTPDKIKQYIARTAKKGTFFSSLALGFIFSFIKIPCIGGIMSALIYNFADNPDQYTGHLIIFYIGLLIPLIIVMYALMKGLQKDKMDKIRVKYRPLLRYISGILILGLTLYAIWDLLEFSPYYLLVPLLIISIIPIILEKIKKVENDIEIKEEIEE